MLRQAILIFAVLGLLQAAVLERSKRQTFVYDDALRAYAHPHPGTKVQQGYLSRYAPQDWPKWYSRNMMKWDGLYRTSPYENNDSRYAQWASNYAKQSRS